MANNRTGKKKNKNKAGKPKPKGANKKKNGGRPRARGPNRAAPRSAQLSQGTAQYAMCLRDPFDGPITGVPSAFPPIPSGKVRYWARGTMTIGSGGTGFVLMNPFYGVVSDLTFVYQTGSTYAGSTLTLAATGVSGASTNSPHNAANMTGAIPLLQARLVSAGLKLYPTMAEVDLNGTYVMLRNPDNQTLDTMNTSAMLAYETASRLPVDSSRRPACVLFNPVNPDELDYGSYTPHSGRYCMGILVSGTASKTFAWEASAVFEEIGSYAHGETPSHADPEGFAAVLNASSDAGSVGYGDALYKTAGQFVSAASQELKTLSGQVLPAIARMSVGAIANSIRSGFSAGSMASGGPGLIMALRDENKKRFHPGYAPGAPAAPPGQPGYTGGATGPLLRVEDVTSPLLVRRLLSTMESFSAFPSQFESSVFPIEFDGNSYQAVVFMSYATSMTWVIMCVSSLPSVYAVLSYVGGALTDVLLQAKDFVQAYDFCIGFGYNLPQAPPQASSYGAKRIGQKL